MIKLLLQERKKQSRGQKQREKFNSERIGRYYKLNGVNGVSF